MDISVDTGFIVFNEINYPNLCNLFKSLNVESYESDMSFAFSKDKGALEYGGSNMSSIFGQKSNFLNLKFRKVLFKNRARTKIRASSLVGRGLVRCLRGSMFLKNRI